MASLLIEIAGWIGAAFVLLAYFLLTNKRLDRESRVYHLMNLGGSIFVALNCILNQAYPSTAINVMWAVIAIYGLIEGFRK